MPTPLVTIAVDAMGGDHAPKAEVEGALRAIRHLAVEVILVGREEVLRAELDAHHAGWKSLPLRLHHASEVVTMDDSAAKSLRQKEQAVVKQGCQKAGIDLELKSVTASVFFSSDCRTLLR